MITFHIITIFPESLKAYLNSSLLKKAQDKKIIKINLVDLRDFSDDKHKKVDDRPFGGGPGMVLKLEPIYKAVKKIKSQISRQEKTASCKEKRFSEKKQIRVKTILFSLGGKKFDQKKAISLSKYNHLILICGHYEGVDERIAKHIADEEISLGNFTLSGGEIPALVIAEATARLLPGFLGNQESLEHKKEWASSGDCAKKLVSIPAYTRPEKFYFDKKNKRVSWPAPKVLLSGNHKEIEEWRKKKMKAID